MQIRFNEVLTPSTFLAKLTSILGDLENLGLHEMTDVRVELRPGTFQNQQIIEMPGSGSTFSGILAIDVEPGSGEGAKAQWVSKVPNDFGTRATPAGSPTFVELVGRYWNDIDIITGESTLSASDDPAALVPRLLRMMIAMMIDLGGNITSTDESAFDAADEPQWKLGERSYWDSTLDDDGFMRMFTSDLFDEPADLITQKRNIAFRNFPVIWRTPLPGVSHELHDSILTELADIFQSRVRAAAVIATKPMRYAANLAPRKGMTLLEALFEAPNRAEIVRIELDGHRRVQTRLAASRRFI